MTIRSLSALAGVLALAGCSSMLTPAPAANQVPDAAEGAIARASGVQMVAKAGAWEGTPSRLSEQLTPMWVTLTNNSAVPVRIRYNELMLVAPQGRLYKALPPFQIDGAVTQRPAAAPLYPPYHFGYAPYIAPYFTGAASYSGAFPLVRPYWDRYGAVLNKVNLPTIDMLQRALPEGVLAPGGKVSGFLYFPGIGGEVERVRLRADLMNATSGEMLVSLSIPFVVG